MKLRTTAVLAALTALALAFGIVGESGAAAWDTGICLKCHTVGTTPRGVLRSKSPSVMVPANAERITGLAQDTLDDLAQSDFAAVAGLYAAEEGVDMADAAVRWNEMANATDIVLYDRSKKGRVDVYEVAGTRVYLLYGAYTVEDGGFLVRRGFKVPMRDSNGQWRLTTLLDRSDTYTLLQSVPM